VGMMTVPSRIIPPMVKVRWQSDGCESTISNLLDSEERLRWTGKRSIICPKKSSDETKEATF